LNEKVKEPYQQIKFRTIQLEHLQTASEILRRLIRFLQLCRRLNSQIQEKNIDLTKAAQILNEIRIFHFHFFFFFKNNTLLNF